MKLQRFHFFKLSLFFWKHDIAEPFIIYNFGKSSYSGYRISRSSKSYLVHPYNLLVLIFTCITGFNLWFGSLLQTLIYPQDIIFNPTFSSIELQQESWTDLSSCMNLRTKLIWMYCPESYIMMLKDWWSGSV